MCLLIVEIIYEYCVRVKWIIIAKFNIHKPQKYNSQKTRQNCKRKHNNYTYYKKLKSNLLKEINICGISGKVMWKKEGSNKLKFQGSGYLWESRRVGKIREESLGVSKMMVKFHFLNWGRCAYSLYVVLYSLQYFICICFYLLNIW